MSEAMGGLLYFVIAVVFTALVISTVKFVLRNVIQFFMGEFRGNDNGTR